MIHKYSVISILAALNMSKYASYICLSSLKLKLFSRNASGRQRQKISSQRINLAQFIPVIPASLPQHPAIVIWHEGLFTISQCDCIHSRLFYICYVEHCVCIYFIVTLKSIYFITKFSVIHKIRCEILAFSKE